MSINTEELAICRRRGHTAVISESGWTPCEACGMWLIERRTIEEREDEPAESELALALKSQRLLDRMGDI